METLALFGGPKTIDRPFVRYNSIGAEEVAAATEVIRSGVLSRYLGCWDPDFFGGDRVQAFEKAWADYFNTAHAIAVNSNTSGLICAIGALGIEPGDEVIVSPWTMCASATAILIWNAIPVFADIEPDTFNLDPAAVEKAITPLTKAIMVTDIFGHAAELDAIMDIARRHNLKVIEDSAQAPGAMFGEKYVGTIADIGVFSLNYHKHINTGEGGVCVTHDPVLAEKLQLIRNHAEAVVGGKGVADITNMIGFNFRMGEIEAAIGIEQLRKLPALVRGRMDAAERLAAGLRGLTGLRVPVVKPGCTHVYYIFPLVYDDQQTGVPRQKLLEALLAEGVPSANGGYVNVHLLPLYQQKIAYGRKGFPWVPEIYKGEVSYAKGICPRAEELNDRSFIGIEICLHDYFPDDVDLVIRAFRKVWSQLDRLR
jgi:perosamine synthetase